jgi:hypothetical protein
VSERLLVEKGSDDDDELAEERRRLALAGTSRDSHGVVH